MHWLLIIGIIFAIVGISNIFQDFIAFLAGVSIGGLLIYLWARKLMAKYTVKSGEGNPKPLSRQIADLNSEQAAVERSEALTPATLKDLKRTYHYKDVNIWVYWQYGGQYGKSCESIGMHRGDSVTLAPPKQPRDGIDDADSIAVVWNKQEIGCMKSNRLRDMVRQWQGASLPIEVRVSHVGGENNLMLEFAFYGKP